jgi:hypothetical protein
MLVRPDHAGVDTHDPLEITDRVFLHDHAVEDLVPGAGRASNSSSPFGCAATSASGRCWSESSSTSGDRAGPEVAIMAEL